MYIPENVINRIKQYISKETDECIEYPNVDCRGYGNMTGRENGKRKHFLMHRVAYQVYYNDDICKDDIICHKCDNPRCINPSHLFKGTHADNMADKVSKGRQAKGNKNGRYIDGRSSDRIVHHPRVYGNLSISQVMEVRELKRRGEKLKDISTILNIPYHTVRDISCGRVYNSIK